MFEYSIIFILIFLILFLSISDTYAIETLDGFLISNDIELEFNPSLNISKLKLIDPVFNGLEFVGHIQNIGNDHVSIGETLFTFYDPKGKAIISFTKFSSKDMFTNQLRPNEISPFEFDIGFGILKQLAETSKVKIDLDIQKVSNIKKEGKIEFRNTELYQDFGYWELLGQVVNNGNTTVFLENIRAAIYNGNDQIVNTETAHFQPKKLEPNEHGGFGIIISRSSEIDNYYANLFVEGDKYSMIEPMNNITIKLNRIY